MGSEMCIRDRAYVEHRVEKAERMARAEAYLEYMGWLPDRDAELRSQVMQRHPKEEAAKTEADAEAVEGPSRKLNDEAAKVEADAEAVEGPSNNRRTRE